MDEVSPIDRIKGKTLGGLSAANINGIGTNVFSNQGESLRDVVSVYEAKKAISTYGSNAVPDQGATSNTNLTDDTPVNVQPPSGEVWQILGALDIENVDPLNAALVTVGLYDGSNQTRQFNTTMAGLAVSLPTELRGAQLTNSVYLRLLQDGSSSSVVIKLQLC